ncbi:fumarylacetoacetate hydrolase family protein [Beutenbergia cavernae]|uniref:fumarylacetoacetate hydrolase family protein n=1 Tax=Beutenbergia cavernae TaxID=84757 RepID=UPI001180A372|nr:fumarylacetoacetate hydrolase family protein [Beutenbergia cavernae]
MPPAPADDVVTSLGLSRRPGKVVCVHLNYRSRAAQRGRTPEFPSYFVKPATSLAASGGVVERPPGTELLGFEGEIALVLGRDARRVSPEDAWACVAAVTAANDLGLYDLRHADAGSNLRSKGGDGFTPLGPALLRADGLDPGALRVRTWVNGVQVQEGTTAELLFGFDRLVADLSQLLTLEAGDVILTGTPAGASVAAPGDVVEVEVDAPTAPGAPSTGRLVTRVVPGSVPMAPFGAQPQVDDGVRAAAYGTSPPGAVAAATAAPQATLAVGDPLPELASDVREALAAVGTATLSAQLRRRGYDDVSVDGVAPLAAGMRLVGRARTLRFVPFRPDLAAERGAGFTPQKRAVEALGAGDVLVVEARGERGTGTVGDILALRAQVRGAAGVVTDGGVRDAHAVAALGLPVFAAGRHPALLGRRHVPWDTDVTIACGGAAVQPGDVVVGDGDGVVVIPAALAEEVARDAVEQERQETFIARQVADGASIDGLYPMDAAWRARYEKEGNP